MYIKRHGDKKRNEKCQIQKKEKGMRNEDHYFLHCGPPKEARLYDLGMFGMLS
jgi:hypothetical protein